MDKLKKWINDHYKAFNICTHQKLPLVSRSPPLWLYDDPKVRPVVCHKTANIPRHLQSDVKAELAKDVRLGVLRKLPLNAQVNSYLHRMVIAKKRTGKVRQTVDLKPLNRACPRQTHAM